MRTTDDMLRHMIECAVSGEPFHKCLLPYVSYALCELKVARSEIEWTPALDTKVDDLWQEQQYFGKS